MRTSQVFRHIWRINAVLILVGSALAVLGLATLLIGELTSARWGGSAAPDASLQGQAASGHSLALGRFELISGTTVAVAHLAVQAPSTMGSSSDTGETRNLLFLDLSSGETSWLLPSHEQELTGEGDLYDPTSPEPRSTLLANLYLVRPVGSAADASGRLLLVAPSGRSHLELAVGVTSVPALLVHSPTEATLLIERAGTHALVPVDLRSFTKGQERQLSIPALTPSPR